MSNMREDIPVGRANAISRQALAQRWGVSEREARRIVAELRAEAGGDGFAILSTSRSPSGFWRSDDPSEILGFISETEARGRNVFAALADARRVLREIEDRRRYPRRLDQHGEV